MPAQRPDLGLCRVVSLCGWYVSRMMPPVIRAPGIRYESCVHAIREPGRKRLRQGESPGVRLDETPEFQAGDRQDEVVNVPLFQVLPYEWKSVLLVIGIVGGAFTATYSYQASSLPPLGNTLGIQTAMGPIAVAIAAALGMIMPPVAPPPQRIRSRRPMRRGGGVPARYSHLQGPRLTPSPRAVSPTTITRATPTPMPTSTCRRQVASTCRRQVAEARDHAEHAPGTPAGKQAMSGARASIWGLGLAAAMPAHTVADEAVRESRRLARASRTG